MRLHEYQAKRILSEFGMPVPRGEVGASVGEVRQIAAWLGKRAVLKAQVLTGGRGRAGGIRLANDPDEAERLASQMFGMDVHGFVATKILVDEAIEIEQEIYLGITIEQTRRAGERAPGLGAHRAGQSIARPVIVASARGGVEIAEVARRTPERVYRIPIDPLLGLRAYQVRELAYDIGLTRERARRFVPIAIGLWKAFTSCDATLVEANPLVICPDGELVSLNAKMIIDDSALFRHRDLSDMRDESQETPSERLARRHGIHYVRLGGYVGCLSNGAGLAMATMDLLRLHEVKAANFVDIGIGAQIPKVIVGLRLALTNSIRAVLINIFGGVTRCDEIARGIVAAYDELALAVPLVVRLEGTNKQAGRELLAQAAEGEGQQRVYLVESLEDAVHKVVELVGEERQGDSAG